MDCDQFAAALPDLDRLGARGGELRAAALAHAESCDRCAELLTESEWLDFSLHSLAANDANRAAPPRVELLLLERFRREKTFAVRRRLRWQLSVWGAAAAALLAVGLSVHYGFLAHPSGKAMDNPSSAAPRESDEAAFTPLPYADDPLTLEGAAVVRVALSGPALASLGVPATEVGDADRILADLVVSADGTPQAIRFVSQASEE